MPRLPRCDQPGRWFHVFHRGIARRPVFETSADVRYFLACIAWAVRRGEIEVHAYCVLTTHFHLLVRSPTGSLAVAMDRILNAYVRYFNRTRRRDGALFRGRYGSRPVDSLAYRRLLVRYIDRNAVQARLAAAAWDFPWCSAWHLVRARRPRWLCTAWTDEEMAEGTHPSLVDAYAAAFAPGLSGGEDAVVRARTRAPANRLDALDDLIDAAPPAVLAWMQRKTKLAEGRARVLPCLDARSVTRTLAEARRARPEWTGTTEAEQGSDAWPMAEAYLLRQLAGATWPAIARRLEVSDATARRHAAQAQALLEADPAFGERIATLARRALDRAHRR